jgi:Tfp pilus assembly protein PilX
MNRCLCRSAGFHPGRSAAAPAGAASLIVVVVLLAVMVVGVVFLNRSLVVEQKTSANQYRQTLAMEAAEAGLEWATAMLNKTEKIGSTCATSAVNTDLRFRQKYVTIDADTGVVTPNAGAIHAACVANQAGTGWTCNCPAAGTTPNPNATAPAGGFQPSFAVVFSASATPGTVRLTSYGCTAPITSDDCTGDAAATVSVTLGAISGLATPPAAPLTARGTVSIGNAALGVINGDPTTNGITINAGMGIDATNVRISTVPGTPPKSTLVGNDASLRETTEDQMFATFFGMSKDAYQSLPTVTKLTCPCTETTVRNAYDNGARQLWLEGNLVMNANLTIGSVTDPVLMVTNGTIEMRGDLNVYGLLYSTGITWDNTGGGSALLRGAAISEGNYTGNGTPDYFYDPNVLKKLRVEASSFARVPGSWRDFTP